MQLEDMVLFSVDDHVIEPRDLFDGREPAEFRGRFPQLLPDAGGFEAWQWEAPNSGNASLNAVVTWPKEEWNLDPATHAEMRPGCYDLDARIDDMNVNGVAVSMCSVCRRRADCDPDDSSAKPRIESRGGGPVGAACARPRRPRCCLLGSLPPP